jgi:hypothetical protein
MSLSAGAASGGLGDSFFDDQNPLPPLVLDAEGQPRQASPLPLILGATGILLSAVIAYFLEELGAEWWSIVGYALTPLLVVLATGWDAISQMSGRKDSWFVIRPLFSKLLRIFAGVSLVIGVIHIWRISEWLAKTAVQQGWPFLT